nr:LOW QUALITY PROTEIN: uncharacterized protein LOC108124655 [Drosophila bipectinata]
MTCEPIELIKPPCMSCVWFLSGFFLQSFCRAEVAGGTASGKKSTNCNINSTNRGNKSNTSNSNNKDEKSLASWLHEEISLECQMRKNLFIFSSNELTERQSGQLTDGLMD